MADLFQNKLYLCSNALVLLTASSVIASCSGSSGGVSTPAAASPVSSTSGNDIDPTATGPSKPGATDVATNPQTMAQVADNGLSSTIAGAALGTTSGATGASLALSASSLGLLTSGTPTQTVTAGNIEQNCYQGSTITQWSASSTPSWPESSSASSIFSDSKDDPSTAADMYVEPILLQYPLTSPTATLSLSTPFVKADIADVMVTDTRTTNIALADLAQTTVTAVDNVEEHRYWSAENPVSGASSAAITCGPKSGTGDAGSSGTANGTYARISWTDENQANGLNLLHRLTSTGTRTRTYLPKVKGAYATTPVTLSSKTSEVGLRLAQWKTSTASISSVPNAAVARQKTITNQVAWVAEMLNASGSVASDTSNLEQIRATDPMIITHYFDSSGNALEHIVNSGTVYKTGAPASAVSSLTPSTTINTADVSWFTSMKYDGVTFDLVNSSQVCIPVAGTVTMTVYASEGGEQKGQITITYSSTPSSTYSGKVDPVITVSGDDADSTRAQWMMLEADTKCDFN